MGTCAYAHASRQNLHNLRSHAYTHWQVGDGATDFSPSPQESRALIAAGYACPATLLLRFADDGIDETPEAAAILAQRLKQSRVGSNDGNQEFIATGRAPASESAWDCVQERLDVPAALAALAALEPPRKAVFAAETGGVPYLGERTLPGSHVTPCG